MIAQLPLDGDTVLVVDGRAGEEQALADTLRRSYPSWTVRSCSSYLNAIAELSRRPALAVVASVETPGFRLDSAVAGLREAAGADTKLVLVCRPENEPLAKSAMRAGANDYVVAPLREKDLDAALGYARRPVGRALEGAGSLTADELSRVAALLRNLDAKPSELLARVAALIQAAFGSKGAAAVLQGAIATAGDAVIKPVLAAPLADAQGQLSLSERESGPYSPGDAEKLRHYASILSDILAAAGRQRNLRELAMTDECSGLANRRFLNEALNDILVLARPKRLPVTLLLFDVDDFKTYNDRFGHDAGDEIIRACGELFRKHCREQDIVARYGGDEFMVVFWDPDGPRTPGSEHPACALSVLDRVKESLRHHELGRPIHHTPINLTISGGVATFPWDGQTREELIAAADAALLVAKRAGKNRVVSVGRPAPTA